MDAREDNALDFQSFAASVQEENAELEAKLEAKKSGEAPKPKKVRATRTRKQEEPQAPSEPAAPAEPSQPEGQEPNEE